MRLIFASAIALFSLLLSACATTGAPASHDPAVSADCAHVDCALMTAVDRKALMRGVTVVWVHLPEKRTVTE